MYGLKCFDRDIHLYNIHTYQKRTLPLPQNDPLCHFQANHYISSEATTALISINITWFCLLRNFTEMELYVLFFSWLLFVCFWDSPVLLDLSEIALFYNWVIFHCMNILQLVYLFTYPWTSWLFPGFSYYEESYFEHINLFVCTQGFYFDLSRFFLG